MGAFALARSVEAKAISRLRPFLNEISGGRYVLTSKGPLSRVIQENLGDILLNDSAGDCYSVELKSEYEDKYRNFYIETWSNRSRQNPGWIYKLTLVDLLFYYFIQSDELYVMNFQRLKMWFDEHRDNHVEKQQKKYDQLNDTWGICVPISLIMREVGLKKFNPLQLKLSLDVS
jgi:hypothetical protein